MPIITKISLEEYFAKEAKATHKSEYHNGEVVAMAGASKAHNVIVSNLLFLLNRCLWDKNCQVYPSDMLLKLEHCQKYVYPDIMIVCENEQNEEHKGLATLLNPLIILEVLSESTKQYDQSEKMLCYLELKSLKQYVMVDSESFNVSSYTKNEKNWTFNIIKNIKEQIEIYDCPIKLEEIYRNINFEKNK